MAPDFTWDISRQLENCDNFVTKWIYSRTVAVVNVWIGWNIHDAVGLLLNLDEHQIINT